MRYLIDIYGWLKMSLINPYSIIAFILFIGQQVLGVRVNAQAIHYMWTIAIVVLFVIGSFAAWEKEHRQLHPFKSNYAFRFTSYVMHNMKDDGPAISLWMRVVNNGGLSSITDDQWEVVAWHNDKPHIGCYDGLTWSITQKVYYVDRGGNEIGSLSFDPSQEIKQLLSRSLKQTEAISGILRVRFPDIPFASLADDDTEIEVCCVDTSEHLYEKRIHLKDVPFKPNRVSANNA